MTFNIEEIIEDSRKKREIGLKMVREGLKEIKNQTQIADMDSSDFIVIPYEFTNGDYSLAFSPERLSHNSAVEKVGKGLGINYKNISKDSLGRDFIGNINHPEANKLLHSLGKKALNLREFNDAGRLLYQGMKGEINVYTVSGNKLDSKFLEKVFNDIYKVQDPWRSEWIDAYFKIDRKEMFVNYHISYKNGNIVKRSEKLDENTMMEKSRISLDDYLDKGSTKQGLPKFNIKRGDFDYWAPENEEVARFDADSSRAVLYCNWDPSDWFSFLGVRAAEQRK